mgnify:CR=1 FL=1
MSQTLERSHRTGVSTTIKAAVTSWQSSGSCDVGSQGAVGVVGEASVDGLGDLPLEAAHGLFLGLSLGDLAQVVVAPGAGVAALDVSGEVHSCEWARDCPSFYVAL